MEKGENKHVKGEEKEGCDFCYYQVRVSLAIQLYYSVIHLIRINNHRAVFERIRIRLKSENDHELSHKL